MTNYEKYKEEIINMLVHENTCLKIMQLRYGENKCKKQTCTNCVNEQKQWLEAEATAFDLEELEAGDKIKMRKLGEKDAWLYEVVCNSFPALWLRFRASENCVSQARDENFLIFYADLSDKYEVHEVIKND